MGRAQGNSMKRTPLLSVAFLLLAGVPASAVHHCPDGSVPILTGHPFRPLLCPAGGKEATRHEAAVSAAARADLGPLQGSWRGLVNFGGGRYEVQLTIGGTPAERTIRWTAMDYHTHVDHTLEGSIKKPGWFSRGVPQLSARMPALPGQKLSGRVWLGAAPLEGGARPRQDRKAVWAFSGRPEQHAVVFALIDPDHVRAVYTFIDPNLGSIGTPIDLARQR